MTKYIIAVLAVVAALLGLFAWGQAGHHKAQEALQKNEAIATQLGAANRALKASEDLRKNEAKALGNRLAAETKARLAAEKKAKNLNEALQAHRDWADVPVPDSVRAALQDGAAGASQGPAPGSPAR